MFGYDSGVNILDASDEYVCKINTQFILKFIALLYLPRCMNDTFQTAPKTVYTFFKYMYVTLMTILQCMASDGCFLGLL